MQPPNAPPPRRRSNPHAPSGSAAWSACRWLLAAALGALGAAAHAADPERRIDIYVQPYYEAARAAGERPNVSVNKSYDALLASTRPEDVARARDAIAANNAMVTPMTLMVLAIRLYDSGYRDDAVFWFYVAKDRYYTLSEVADVRAPQLAQVEDAVRNFALLAGPAINGYAFCDVTRQQAARDRAAQWVAANPYRALELPQLPARPGNRADNLARAVAALQANAAKERAYLDDPANLAKLREARRQHGADAKYCFR